MVATISEELSTNSSSSKYRLLYEDFEGFDSSPILNEKITLLNIGCTHGDEPIGLHLMDLFDRCIESKRYKCNAILANEKALSRNQRYIDTDLNRAFPGNPDGNHEEKLAYELNQEIKKYDVVIDWHQSVAEMDDLIFIKRRTPLIDEICSCFNIKHIVELDQGKGDYDGLLIYHAENAIAIEYGNKHDRKSAERRFERDFYNLISDRKKFPNKKYYCVYGKVDGQFRDKLILKNFQKLSDEQKRVLSIYSSEDIYPVFINGYENEGTYCKLLKPINYNN